MRNELASNSLGGKNSGQLKNRQRGGCINVGSEINRIWPKSLWISLKIPLKGSKNRNVGKILYFLQNCKQNRGKIVRCWRKCGAGEHSWKVRIFVIFLVSFSKWSMDVWRANGISRSQKSSTRTSRSARGTRGLFPKS